MRVNISGVAVIPWDHVLVTANASQTPSDIGSVALLPSQHRWLLPLLHQHMATPTALLWDALIQNVQWDTSLDIVLKLAVNMTAFLLVSASPTRSLNNIVHFTWYTIAPVSVKLWIKKMSTSWKFFLLLSSYHLTIMTFSRCETKTVSECMVLWVKWIPKHYNYNFQILFPKGVLGQTVSWYQ